MGTMVFRGRGSTWSEFKIAGSLGNVPELQASQASISKRVMMLRFPSAALIAAEAFLTLAMALKFKLSIL